MSGFKAKRIVQSHTMQISAPAASVFPLLCPVREYDWIDTWSCDLTYSHSGVAENHCVFQTDRQGEGKRNWVVSRYEPDHIIEFVIFQQDSAIIKLDLYLSENAEGTTQLRVSHTFTGLNEIGNAAIESLPADFTSMRWTRLAEALNHYMQTGTMFKTRD